VIGAHRRLAALAVVVAAAACESRTRESGDAPVEATARLADRAGERSDDPAGFIAALTPAQSADVTAPYTSPVTRLAVKLGDRVGRGAVLAQLDDRQLRQELDAARAQLHTAEAAVHVAQIDQDSAEIVLQRETAAEAGDVTSHAEVVTAQRAVDKAGAALTVARATVDEHTTRIAELQAHLSEMTLVAPIAGGVAMIYVEDGARVEAGRPVLRVISSGVFVKFAIPADQAGAVKPGDTVDLRVDGRAALLTAKVGHISPELDAVAQMIVADAELVNPPVDLQPGTVGRILPRTRPHR
jgi:macrolide-specific efflux system membrane fusion protein